jgi:hypothetical protein
VIRFSLGYHRQQEYGKSNKRSEIIIEEGRQNDRGDTCQYLHSRWFVLLVGAWILFDFWGCEGNELRTWRILYAHCLFHLLLTFCWLGNCHTNFSDSYCDN